MAFTLRTGGLFYNNFMRASHLQEAHISYRSLHWKGNSSNSSRSRMQLLWDALCRSSGETRLRSRCAHTCGLIARNLSNKLKQLENKICMYQSVCSEHTLQSLAIGFARKHLRGRRRNYVLFGGACFAWDRERVDDKQLESCLDDVDLISILRSDKNSACEQLTDWEKVMTKSQMTVWRRRLNDMYLYEYKVFGTYTDCTAKSFYRVQMDLKYRKSWDKHAIETDIIDKDKESGTEVVYWATHFPYPMHSRDYVYARRSKIFHRHRVMAIVSQATDHPRRPASKRHVRVMKFTSRMVIKPFTSFDEVGFDYMLTYHDDPQVVIPSSAVSWMTSTGVPQYVENMHEAAVSLDSMSGTNFKDLQSEEQQYTTQGSGCYS